MTRRLPALLLAIAIAVAAFVWLDHVNSALPANDDGVRDQLLARDCTDLGQCHTIGPGSSVSGFHQGAVWLDLLIGVRLLGGDAWSQRTLVLALLSIGAGTLFIVVWNWLSPSIALPAVIMLIHSLSLFQDPSLLVNGSAAPFPDILTTAGLLCYGLSGEWRFLLSSAFTLGVGINVYRIDAPRPSIATYEIPLSPLAGETRDFFLPDCSMCCGSWHVTRVDGLQVEGVLPAKNVRLRSDGGGRGRLIVQRTFDPNDCSSDRDTGYPPCILEMPAADPLRVLAESQ